MLCLSARESVLTCEVFPPLNVSRGEWELGLVDLTTFHSIPNIETGVNDKFYYADKVITIEEGAYEIDNIGAYIRKQLPDSVKFELKANNNTLKTEISCSEPIHFKDQSLATLLGFKSDTTLEPNKVHSSPEPVDILRVNVIRVECNIVRGSYDNGAESHVLHEFYPLVEPGFKIVESPNPIIYLPLNVRQINNVTVTLKDQCGRLVNFRKETISVRLHLRRRRDGVGI